MAKISPRTALTRSVMPSRSRKRKMRQSAARKASERRTSAKEPALPAHIRQQLEFASDTLKESCSPEQIEELRRRRRKTPIQIIQRGITPFSPLTETVSHELYIEAVFHKLQQAEWEAKRWKRLGPQKYLGSEATDALRDERQKEVAQRPRPDALQRLIIDILQENPKATASDVKERLRKYEHSDVIDTFTDDGIEWSDRNQTSTMSWSALKDRVSRAKKLLK